MKEAPLEHLAKSGKGLYGDDKQFFRRKAPTLKVTDRMKFGKYKGDKVGSVIMSNPLYFYQTIVGVSQAKLSETAQYLLDRIIKERAGLEALYYSVDRKLSQGAFLRR